MCHVLIIEDLPSFAVLLREAVEEAGATSVAIAATERGAVRSAIRHAPSIVTSDVDLLEGSGPAAVRRIRRRFGAIPVLFITARPGFRPPMPSDRVLTKPITYRQMSAALRQLILAHLDPRPSAAIGGVAHDGRSS